MTPREKQESEDQVYDLVAEIEKSQEKHSNPERDLFSSEEGA